MKAVGSSENKKRVGQMEALTTLLRAVLCFLPADISTTAVTSANRAGLPPFSSWRETASVSRSGDAFIASVVIAAAPVADATDTGMVAGEQEPKLDESSLTRLRAVASLASISILFTLS